jgi:hypothetical protein
MTTEPRVIHVREGSELAHALDEVNGAPLRLVKGNRTYLVSRESDLWAGYNPEKVRAAMREAAGTLTPEEAEKLKRHIYHAREEGSRPPNTLV